MLSERERKLLQLGLGIGAYNGEIDNAAVMFFRSLRARGVNAEQIEEATGPTSVVSPGDVIYTRPDYGLTQMRFGKHKGELFKDIPPAYLGWLLRTKKAQSVIEQRDQELIETIENFLAQ